MQDSSSSNVLEPELVRNSSSGIANEKKVSFGASSDAFPSDFQKPNYSSISTNKKDVDSIAFELDQLLRISDAHADGSDDGLAPEKIERISISNRNESTRGDIVRRKINIDNTDSNMSTSASLEAQLTMGKANISHESKSISQDPLELKSNAGQLPLSNTISSDSGVDDLYIIPSNKPSYDDKNNKNDLDIYDNEAAAEPLTPIQIRAIPVDPRPPPGTDPANSKSLGKIDSKNNNRISNSKSNFSKNSSSKSNGSSSAGITNNIKGKEKDRVRK
jgi:hypothetical protein